MAEVQETCEGRKMGKDNKMIQTKLKPPQVIKNQNEKDNSKEFQVQTLTFQA